MAMGSGKAAEAVALPQDAHERRALGTPAAPPQHAQERRALGTPGASVGASASGSRGASPAAGALATSFGTLDRARLAKTVGRALAGRGMPGRAVSGAASSGTASGVTEAVAESRHLRPSEIASEIAARLFVKSIPSTSSASGQAHDSPSPAPEAVAAAAIEIASFVSEADVKRAVARGEKIFLGRRSIVTPAARDLGLEHNVLVETEGAKL